MNDRINQLIAAALAAVNPFDSIQNHLRLDGNDLVIGDRVINSIDKDIRCVAIGKASVPMARSIHTLLGSRISQGLVVTKYAHLGDARFPPNWECIESAHPVPNERSLDAGDRVWKFLADCTDRTLVLACISGGASALAMAPHNWSALIELLTNSPTVEISKQTQQLIDTFLLNRSIDINAIDPRSNISLAALQAIGIALLGSGL